MNNNSFFHRFEGLSSDFVNPVNNFLNIIFKIKKQKKEWRKEKKQGRKEHVTIWQTQLFQCLPSSVRETDTVGGSLPN